MSLSHFAAQQPHYFPSVAYFSKIAGVDHFVLADDLQFHTHGEMNRARIKAADGARWLTTPVLTKGKAGQLIKEVRIDNAISWRIKHWKTLRSHYGRAPYFEKYAERLERIFRQEWRYLVDLNLAAFEFLHRALHLQCAWQLSSVWGITARGTERIVEMGKRLNCSHYLTERKNSKFLPEDSFAGAGLVPLYTDFEPRHYHQQYEGFVPNLSVLDLLLNEGGEARSFLKVVTLKSAIG